MTYSTPLMAPKLLFFYLRLPNCRDGRNSRLSGDRPNAYLAEGSERLSSESTSSLMMDVASALA